jgi:hypothetical protein
MIVARISNNVAWVTSWRATMPSSVSGALSVRIGGKREMRKFLSRNYGHHQNCSGFAFSENLRVLLIIEPSRKMGGDA